MNAFPVVVDDIQMPNTTAAVINVLFVFIVIPLDLLSPIWSSNRNLGIREKKFLKYRSRQLHRFSTTEFIPRKYKTPAR
jgi:hypothetical protein